jgi:AraC-like DNA-binding protein
MEYSIDGSKMQVSPYLWQSNSSITSRKIKEKLISECNQAFLERVRLLIEENLISSKFGNKELAEKLHISVSQLFRKIKCLTNKSTSNYINTIRLAIAKKMLISTEFTIAEIAFKTGFNDPSYFTRTFVKEFGITPGKVRVNKATS